MITRFVGVDLAWQSNKNHTGIVVAEGESGPARAIEAIHQLNSLEAVVEAIVRSATENTVVAVDAPLIIRNETGRRPCETEVSRRFGAAHASAHSSNLTLYPSPATLELVRRLEAEGFRHAPLPHTEGRRDGRWFFEVYPHPASVVLFNLEKIVKYKRKKGMTTAGQRAGLERFRTLLAGLRDSDPALIPTNEVNEELFESDLDLIKGKGLKQIEDLLDAYLCAYVALHYWAWGIDRNELFGDMDSGYIVVPCR